LSPAADATVFIESAGGPGAYRTVIGARGPGAAAPAIRHAQADAATGKPKAVARSVPPASAPKDSGTEKIEITRKVTPAMQAETYYRQGLDKLQADRIEGRNIVYEHLFAGGSREKVAELAKVAAAQRPDLIVAPTALAAISASKATKTIPIVFSTVSDPTVVGLAASLARPGANATGTFQIQTDLVAKRFEMVREALPKVKRVGVVLEGVAVDQAVQRERHLDAGRRSGLEVSIGSFMKFDDIPGVLAGLKREGVDVLTVGSSFTLIGLRTQFAEMARQAGIPLIAHRVEWAEAGAVLTYGADVGHTLRRTAQIAHRILNGARPAETPIEQASRFELVVNLRAAKEYGLALPKLFLARADRVIE
jgi:putative ABC transport system substrate-binding protein